MQIHSAILSLDVSNGNALQKLNFESFPQEKTRLRPPLVRQISTTISGRRVALLNSKVSETQRQLAEVALFHGDSFVRYSALQYLLMHGAQQRGGRDKGHLEDKAILQMRETRGGKRQHSSISPPPFIRAWMSVTAMQNKQLCSYLCLFSNLYHGKNTPSFSALFCCSLMYNAAQYSQLRFIVFVHVPEGLFTQENPWIYEKRLKKEYKGKAQPRILVRLARRL